MGAVDILYFKNTALKCWDIVAGILIIQEAGGIVLDIKGKNYSRNANKIPIMINIKYD